MKKTILSLSFCVSLLSCLVVTAVSAQPCPIDSTQIIVDTLDSSNYIPYNVGEIRDYSIFDAAFLEALQRQVVVGDTVIDGQLFLQVMVVDYQTNRIAITGSDTTMSYERFDEGHHVSVDKDGSIRNDVELDADFQTCYTAFDGTPVEVYGSGVAEEFVFPNGDSLETTTKEFVSFGNSGVVYGSGIGQVREWGDGGYSKSLEYFFTGSDSLGIPIDSTYGTVSGISPNEILLVHTDIFPSPFSESFTLRTRGGLSGPVSIFLYDSLGRIQSMKFLPSIAPNAQIKFESLRGLSAGIYFVEIRSRINVQTKAVIKI